MSEKIEGHCETSRTWRCLDKNKNDVGYVCGQDLQEAKTSLRISEAWPSCFEAPVFFLKADNSELIQVR